MRVPGKTRALVWLLVAYGPMLLSRPGRVSADSKQLLYLDPGGLVEESRHLWDPGLGAGGVPHQGLGYLFPVAPFFWAGEVVGLPDWVVQRLWLGTLLLSALVGTRWLLGQLGVGAAGAAAGALVYGLTPYQLAFDARMSVLLLPWAALPWLVGWTMRATRGGGWRAPAAIALVLVLTGGVNASSLLLVAIGPALWLLLEAASGRPGPALRAAGAVALLGGGVSLWWLVGIRLQGAYGLPVLQLTEGLPTVAAASNPADVLRGLGNWFFTGRDRVGYAVAQAADYEHDRLVIALSFAVPLVGLVAGFAVRWAHRRYFALLVVVGTVVAVGSWPYDDPSPYGRAWRAFAEETSVGLAFRNSPRAAPLVALGIAGLLAAGVGALPRLPARRVGGAVVAVLAAGALLPVADGGFLSRGLDRPEDLPAHWLEAGAVLEAGDHATRILEVPGASFAAYTWGNTVDPVTPGLTDRPYLAREVLPAGTVASVNLLEALDRRIQLGTFEPSSLVPIARLFAVGTVVVRADLDRSGRYDSPPVEPFWAVLQRADPPGLGAPQGFGPDLAGDGAAALQAVELLPLEDPVPIVRTRRASMPLLVAGDGDGLVDAAAAGLLAGDDLVLYGAALDDDALAAALDDGARLVVTDSNRRRAQTWFYAIRDTRGRTEQAGETAPDPTGYDHRLELFPGAGDDARTVVEQVGGRVSATMEGGPERPEDKAVHATDGDPTSAWRVGGDPTGAVLTIEPDTAEVVDEVILRQPAGERHLRRVRLLLDDRPPIDVDLGEASLGPTGQAVALGGEIAVRRLRIEVLAADPVPAGGGPAPVGLSEVSLGGARVEETVLPPRDLLDRAGDSAELRPLDVVLTRLRSADPARADEEPRLDRTLELPAERTFTLAGLVRSRQDDGGAAATAGACRDDLVSVDGAPVPVRVVPGPVPGELVLEGCAPLALGSGRHRLQGTSTGALAVDRLVLSSPATGPDAVSAEAPPVHVRSESFDRLDLEIEPTTEPFWLVLGQSASDGWDIEVAGATAGPRQLVDGYANGWRLTPTGDGPMTVTLRWTPQRLVGLGLAVSMVAVVAAGMVLWRGRRVRVDLAAPPQMATTARAGRTRAGAAVSAAVAGVVALAVATPAVAVVTVAAVAGAGLVGPRRGWVVPAALAPAAVVASRLLERPTLAWLAVTLLAGVVVLERPRRTEEPSAG